ncbi:MAG: aminopeptidase [Bullifex sp.]|nr:aminopeptidase [Spirochaetales bacterium]MDY5776242.1 aminopeptidase [Bullifex sp.]
MNTISERYASYIINRQLRLETGEKLTVNCNEDTLEFAGTLSKMAAEATGVPVQLVYIRDGKVETVEEVDPDFTAKANGKAVMVHLASFPSFKALDESDLSARELQEYRLIAEPVITDRQISVPWATVYVPTAAWAEFVYGQGATTDSLWLMISDMLALDREGIDLMIRDSIHTSRRKRIEDERITDIFIKGPSADLHLKRNRRARITGTLSTLRDGRSFEPTSPAEDTVIALDEFSGEGTFRTTYPFRLFDRVFQDAAVTIENGRIKSFSTEGGALHVSKYLNIDEESGRVGELAIADGYTPVSRVRVASGIPALDQMRTTSLVFGGITPAAVTPGSDEELKQDGVNTSFVRLVLPIGDMETEIKAYTEDGRYITLMEDGIMLF